METGPGQVDYGRQIARLRHILGGYSAEERTIVARDVEGLARRWGVARRGEGLPAVVVGDDVGVELGRPGTESRALLLTTGDTHRIHDGLIRCCGPELAGAGRPLPLALIVLVAMDPEQPAHLAQLESALHLTNRLPGVMSRTLPGRLWIRVGRGRLRDGFGLSALGTAAWVAFRRDFPQLLGVEVIVATHGALIAELSSLAAEAHVLAGKQRKLRLVGEGEAECLDLACGDCDDQPLCDELRDITIRYRRQIDDTG